MQFKEQDFILGFKTCLDPVDLKYKIRQLVSTVKVQIPRNQTRQSKDKGFQSMLKGILKRLCRESSFDSLNSSPASTLEHSDGPQIFKPINVLELSETERAYYRRSQPRMPIFSDKLSKPGQHNPPQESLIQGIGTVGKGSEKVKAKDKSKGDNYKKQEITKSLNTKENSSEDVKPVVPSKRPREAKVENLVKKKADKREVEKQQQNQSDKVKQPNTSDTLFSCCSDKSRVKMLQCVGPCSNWYHYKCAGLASKRNSSIVKNLWKCSDCLKYKTNKRQKTSKNNSVALTPSTKGSPSLKASSSLSKSETASMKRLEREAKFDSQPIAGVRTTPPRIAKKLIASGAKGIMSN